jgi:hypothetical protein
MKTAEDMVWEWQSGEDLDSLPDVLRAYGEQVREECAKVVESIRYNNGGMNSLLDSTAYNVRHIKLP